MCSQNARIIRLLLLIEQNDFYAEVPQRAFEVQERIRHPSLRGVAWSGVRKEENDYVFSCSPAGRGLFGTAQRGLRTTLHFGTC